MKSRVKRRAVWQAATLGTVLASGIPAAAQQPPPGGPPFGGFQGGPLGPGGPGMGRRGFGGPPPASLARLPLSMLTSELKLSSSQKRDIARIQDGLRRPGGPGMMPGGAPPPGFGPGQGPPPGGRGPDGGPGQGPPPGGFGPNGGPRAGPPEGPGGPAGPPPGAGPYGGPPTPGGFGQPGRGFRGAMAQADRAASRKMEALLTPEQRQQTPALLDQARAFWAAGIPLPVYTDLKLTSDQKQRLAAIGAAQRPAAAPAEGAEAGGPPPRRPDRAAAHRSVMALLTASQRSAIEDYRREHGNELPGFGPPPGGPGFGGPPPGGPGFGGPPPGGGGAGFGGPPPGGPGGGPDAAPGPGIPAGPPDAPDAAPPAQPENVPDDAPGGPPPPSEPAEP